MKQRRLFGLALLVATALLSASPVQIQALTDAEVASLENTVANARVPELAATAARIVSESPQKQQEEIAVELVKIILKEHPGTAAAVVGAVAKAAPDVGAAVASAASDIVPTQAPQIARAAAVGARKNADKVAIAVAKRQPKEAVKVARFVVSVAPEAAPRVIGGIAAEVPSAKTGLAALPRVRLSSAGAASAPGERPVTFKFQQGFPQKDLLIRNPVTGETKLVDTTLEFVPPPEFVPPTDIAPGVDQKKRPDPIDYKRAR